MSEVRGTASALARNEPSGVIIFFSQRSASTSATAAIKAVKT